MKVDEKSGRMGNHTEGASKTVFVLICRRFNWRSSQMGFSRGGPRLLFVPEFSAVAEIIWVRGLDCLPVRYSRIEHKQYPQPRVTPGISTPATAVEPESVNQAKAPLDKLSPRASKDRYSQFRHIGTSRVINHPVLVPHPLPRVFPHHRAIFLHSDT